jgi:hypothetical protein
MKPTLAELAELDELRRTHADWQRQFRALRALCAVRGLRVQYGDRGEVTLVEAMPEIIT